MSKIAVLSDIHGNMPALESVFQSMEKQNVDKIILLGDLIDYGMQSNEVVHFFKEKNPYPIICGIWGNHEKAIIDNQFSGFSSKRGVDCAKYTAGIIDQETKEYIKSDIFDKTGIAEFNINYKKCLAVHGSLKDAFWKSISPMSLNGNYSDYHIVFSGHSHLPHCFSFYYETDNEDYRNKKKTIFINPGSVGQPRNHNPNAQYAIFDSENGSVLMAAVEYNVERAMTAYANKPVDSFYKTRLKRGV